MPDPVHHHHRARAPKQLAIVALGLIAVLATVFLFDAALWVAALLALVTLPALFDIATDRHATLDLDDTHLSWESGRRTGHVPLDRIAKVKLRTTLDLSLRAQLFLKDGRKTRLPVECLPPGRALEDALAARDVLVERGMF